MKDDMARRARTRSRIRRSLQAGFDSLAWVTAIVSAAILVSADHPSGAVALMACVAAAGQALSGVVVGITLGRWKVGSFDELPPLALSALLTTIVVLLVDALVPSRWSVGGATVVVAALIASALMIASRYVRRWRVTRGRKPEHALPIIVFGAGNGGSELTATMRRDRHSPYLPVSIIDDDPRKRGARISGVKVAGDRSAVVSEAVRTGARTMVIAIPSASRETIGSIADVAHAAGLAVLVAPSLRELVGRAPLPDEVRSLGAADLLGRQEIQTNVAEIAGYISGRRVLVTGAGGSIGSELCRQLHQFAPTSLVMLDRDESALHAVKLSLDGRAMLDTPDLVLADLRDAPRMRAVLAEYRPDVIFHAAALKHLPLLEQHPGEAVLSNIWGTLELLDAAAASGVGCFVNISTDKAADPVNVLGYSKRIAERLVARYAGAGTFLSVRFGNVLGSRGSSLVAFEAQIAAGGPVTVTDPAVTRYFMTVGEAVELVIQAGAIGSPGEVMVLDMGDPVRIDDLVRRLIAQSGRDIPIVYTGLRAGEKLHEDLFGSEEEARISVHPLISSVAVTPLDAARVLALDPTEPPAVLIPALRELALDGAAAVANRPQ